MELPNKTLKEALAEIEALKAAFDTIADKIVKADAHLREGEQIMIEALESDAKMRRLIKELCDALYCHCYRKIDPDHPSVEAKEEWDVALIERARKAIR